MVAMARVVEQVGVQLVELKEAVTPAGNPEAVKVDMGSAVPETSVAVMVLETDAP